MIRGIAGSIAGFIVMVLVTILFVLIASAFDRSISNRQFNLESTGIIILAIVAIYLIATGWLAGYIARRVSKGGLTWSLLPVIIIALFLLTYKTNIPLEGGMKEVQFMETGASAIISVILLLSAWAGWHKGKAHSIKKISG